MPAKIRAFNMAPGKVMPVGNNIARHLSLGAGVDTAVLLLMSVEGILPKYDHAIFADTQAEPSYVYQQLDWLVALAAKADIPVSRITTGNLAADSIDPNLPFMKMPLYLRMPDGTVGMLRRMCTGDYKTKPIIKKQMELLGVAPRSSQKHILVETHIGFTWDETERMKDPPRKWMKNIYPLIDMRMTRDDCLRWLADRGYPQIKRSACFMCPFRDDWEWSHMKHHDQETWAQAVEFDRALRRVERDKPLRGIPYLHHSCVPLDEVIFAEEAGVVPMFRTCDPWGCSPPDLPEGVVLFDSHGRRIA